jgi:hypothetical protein
LHPAWEARKILKEKIVALLESEVTPVESRLVLWSIFAEGNSSLTMLHEGVPADVQSEMREEVLNDLRWAHSVLSSRVGNFEELKAAQDLWSWHARFDTDEEIKVAAEALEDLFKANSLATEFDWLLNECEPEDRSQRVTEIANRLAKQDHDEIDKFIDRASSVLAGNRDLSRVSDIAWELGASEEERPGVREFIRAMLQSSEATPKTLFAIGIARRQVVERRKVDPSGAKSTVAGLLEQCSSDDVRLNLLFQLYGQIPRPAGLGIPTDDEFRFVRSQEQWFLSTKRGPAFIACAAWGIDFEWSDLKSALERVFDAIGDDEFPFALKTLVDAIFWGLRGREANQIPKDVSVWMLDQLLRIPRAGDLDQNLVWYVNNVLEQTSRAPIEWLQPALRRRHELEKNRGYGNGEALSHSVRWSNFVEPIGETDGLAPDVEKKIDELLKFISNARSLNFYLPDIIKDVDPHGRLVPQLIAIQIEQLGDVDAMQRLARASSAFTIGSTAWKTIARPVLKRACSTGSVDERIALFSSLAFRRSRAWAGVPGEVPAIFKLEVESTRTRLDAETEPAFRPFWEWQLECAVAELRNQEEEAKEERGE